MTSSRSRPSSGQDRGEQTDEQQALADEQKELAEDQQDLADIRAGAIRVNRVATVKLVGAPTTVTQIDGDPSVTITGTPDTTDLGALSAAVTTTIAGIDDLPAGVSAELGGAATDQQEAFSQLGLAMLVAIALVFLIMVGTFRSLVQPLILMVAIPFAATGAIAGLLITDTPLGVPSMVGLLMLIGIVVTNAIVLIDLINQYRVRGEDLKTAVVDGARLRLRPIIMTACATICALIPMGNSEEARHTLCLFLFNPAIAMNQYPVPMSHPAATEEATSPVQSPFESWGRYPTYGAKLLPLHWQSDFPALTANLHNGALPVGMGRSYGDVCLLKDGNLLVTTAMNRLIALRPRNRPAHRRSRRHPRADP